jgi:hypothetical protein
VHREIFSDDFKDMNRSIKNKKKHFTLFYFIGFWHEWGRREMCIGYW